MEFAPRCSLSQRKLYRNVMLAVTLAVTLMMVNSRLAAQVTVPQYGRKSAIDKGPRALGIVEITPKGKARIIPITIMMDGQFYDASAYKASPVPMALDFGIVYEAFRSGVSQGIFTITQPGQLNHSWIAEGTWFPAGTKPPEKNKKYSTPVIADDDNDARPVLHRRTPKTDSDSGADGAGKSGDQKSDKDKSDKDKSDKASDEKAATGSASTTDKSSSGQTQTSTAQPASATPAATKSADTSKTQTSDTTASSPDEPVQDPNRPRLRRGKPEPTPHQEPFVNFDTKTDTSAATANGSNSAKPGLDAAKDSTADTQVTLIPAISDAGGPDARPYTYEVKPVEEAIYRNKMLDLAATQVSSQASGAKKQAGSRPVATASKTSKASKPEFDDVRLRIFDLSNSNEPVLVLSAKTRVSEGAAGSVGEPKEITLIARTNLEGELRKLFFSQTDSRHHDVTPRMELIDAIDADGDGRGELLFRRVFDDGSAYAIYRVSADRLWPLFEGTP